MKDSLRVDAGFEFAVAIALAVLVLNHLELPIPGHIGSLVALAIIFSGAGIALWLLSSRAGMRLVAAVAAANAAGGVLVASWLAVEASHVPAFGFVLAITVALGFFALAALEVFELRRAR